MIEINKVEYSKNPVSSGETFIISVTVSETFATWADLKTKTWAAIKAVTWDKVKRKIF